MTDAELQVDQCWAKGDYPDADFATIYRIESGVVRFRYVDEPEGNGWAGRASMTIDNFRATYPFRRITWIETQRGPVETWGDEP